MPFNPLLGQNLVEKLKDTDFARNRIRLDGLVSPPPEKNQDATVSVNAESTRKLFRVAQMESVRSRLRSVKDSCVSYKEFIRICEECCTDHDQAKLVAKMLDDSASVVVLGDFVFLRPEQVNTF